MHTRMKKLQTLDRHIPSSAGVSAAGRTGSLIGGTPLHRLAKILSREGVTLSAKLEWRQLGGSVKARAAWHIVGDALQQGKLREGMRLLDASSGNTGIAYAHIGAALGIPVTLCLPENASKERRRILQALGVDLRLTSAGGGTEVARRAARELHESDPELFYYADQYNNSSNPKAHYEGTAPEILEQSEYKITHFVAGLGTTGTFTGTGRRLKEHDPEIRLVGLQPDLAMHGLEGWKHLETSTVPGIYDESLADRVVEISTAQAHRHVRRAAREEGLLLSPSSAANLAGALRVAGEIGEGHVVTVFPDDGSRYGEIISEIFNG